MKYVNTCTMINDPGANIHISTVLCINVITMWPELRRVARTSFMGKGVCSGKSWTTLTSQTKTNSCRRVFLL